jgi:hypothetical protein
VNGHGPPVCQVCRGEVLRCRHCGGPVFHTVEVEDLIDRPIFHICLHCGRSFDLIPHPRWAEQRRIYRGGLGREDDRCDSG